MVALYVLAFSAKILQCFENIISKLISAGFIWVQLGRFLQQDLATIFSSNRLLSLVVAETFVLMLAELFIGLSITHKNVPIKMRH